MASRGKPTNREHPVFSPHCEDPYLCLDEFIEKGQELKDELRELSRTADIFEQATPEFKELAQLDLEIKMIKNLWDYANIITSNLTEWKKTVWKKLDIEGMDVECKKFTRELRRK